METAPDDLDAVRKLVEALSPFERTEQERIIRWAQEKLGLVVSSSNDSTSRGAFTFPTTPRGIPTGGAPTDIKSFIAEKRPASDNQFAATVAYYYKFVAPTNERKDEISSEDLQEACRKAGRPRLRNPGATLRNAHYNAGVLDAGTTRGNYSINTVGENLVVLALPADQARSEITSRTKIRPKKKGQRPRR
jgi:hypothetical protein